MNRNLFHITLSFVFLLLLPVIVLSQESTEVKASVNRSGILIGEQIELRLEADIPENSPIRFFRIDSLPHFEVLERRKIDTSNTGRGTVLSQVLYITSFDSGRWVLPALTLGDSIFTDTIPIDVGYTPMDTSKPYNDIKDIIEAEAEEKKQPFQWWWIVAGAAALIILLILVFRKKKPAAPPPPAPPIDPYKEAMEGLEKIRQESPERKVYYTKLIDIFRLYVDKKKSIRSLQETTGDLVAQLKQTDLPPALLDRLAASMRMGDMVKFAKGVTTPEDDKQIFDAVKESITYLEQH